MFHDNLILLSGAFHFFPIKGMLLDDLIIMQGPLVEVYPAQRLPILAGASCAVDMGGEVGKLSGTSSSC